MAASCYGGGQGRDEPSSVLGGWRCSVLRTPIHKIYASDLKRVHSTAVQLVAPRTSLPGSDKDAPSFPPIHTTPMIRDQHFGIAEGKLWFAGPGSKKKQQHQRASARDDDKKRLHRESEVYETIHN